jgi:hypothetical protein
MAASPSLSDKQLSYSHEPFGGVFVIWGANRPPAGMPALPPLPPLGVEAPPRFCFFAIF